MSNPLQPKVISVLEKEYNAFVINITAASKAGNMDLVCSIKGLFYGFEIKWKNDRPSMLQKQKINKCTASGGRAYFIRSIDMLRHVIDNEIPSEKYDLGSGIVL